jgi:hypothetical protein
MHIMQRPPEGSIKKYYWILLAAHKWLDHVVALLLYIVEDFIPTG